MDAQRGEVVLADDGCEMLVARVARTTWFVLQSSGPPHQLQRAVYLIQIAQDFGCKEPLLSEYVKMGVE